ncbi:hypothetical protein Tco_1217352 [Tanacetum coccineum]
MLIIIFEDVQQAGEQPKDVGKRCKGNTNYLSLCSLMNIVAVQREIRVVKICMNFIKPPRASMQDCLPFYYNTITEELVLVPDIKLLPLTSHLNAVRGNFQVSKRANTPTRLVVVTYAAGVHSFAGWIGFSGSYYDSAGSFLSCGCFVFYGSYGYAADFRCTCWWVNTSVGDSFLLSRFVYAANTSIHAAGLFDIAELLVSATSHEFMW